MTFIKDIPDPGLSDAELVASYRAGGNMQVLALLFQRYIDLLYGVCLKYLKEPEVAKDAVMQVFEQLVPRLRQHEVENFRSWCYTLAKNHCLMQLRSPRNLKTTEFRAEIMQSEEILHLNGEMTKEDNLQRMEICLQALPEEQKKTIELFYLRQKSYKEISELTGIEWNQVRSHIQNGRRNLKICMEKQNQEITHSRKS